MRNPRHDLDVDYRIRSVALIRDPDFEVKFQVLCYGMSHSDLASVQVSEGGDMSGGTKLRHRLERRGINTDDFRANVFDTEEVRENFDFGHGKTREIHHRKPVVFPNDPEPVS